MTHTLEFGGEVLTLHPWGSLYWERKSMLLISDVHLGKIMHFRKYGAAVPRKAVHRNFERLDGLYKYFRPGAICFLGDLFHSHMNQEWQFFRDWVGRCPANVELVMGNHDIISPLRYEELSVRCSETLETGPFILTHHPMEAFQGYNITGHIHPAVRLKGSGRQQLRLPCFYLRGRQLILPAFGSFTGSHALKPLAGDRIFALADGHIIPLEEPSVESS